MTQIVARNAQAVLTWPQDIAGDVASYNVYQVDPAEVGFGNGPFGYEAFGRGDGVDYLGSLTPQAMPNLPDLASPDGFGDGDFGNESFGGVDLLEFVTPALADGDYEFAVIAFDQAGNSSPAPAALASVSLAGIPRPPTNLQASSYEAGTLELTWTKSPDDN